MVALFLIPAILSQNSAMLDKASQASCFTSDTASGGTLCVYVCINKIGMCVCLCGGGGVFVDISCRNQM